MNSGMVAAASAMYFTVTTLNPIPPEGGVQLCLPKWNPLAPLDSRESYIIDTFPSDPDMTFVGTEAGDIDIDLSQLCSAKRVSSNPSSPFDPLLSAFEFEFLLNYMTTFVIGCRSWRELLALLDQ